MKIDIVIHILGVKNVDNSKKNVDNCHFFVDNYVDNSEKNVDYFFLCTFLVVQELSTLSTSPTTTTIILYIYIYVYSKTIFTERKLSTL